MKVTILLSFILLTGILPPATAQRMTEAAMQKKLVGLINDLQGGGYGEGTEEANSALEDFLLDAGRRYPEMMTWKFYALDTTGLRVLTSDDGKFRIYNWDQWNGGTMHFYSGVIQYETAPGKTATVPLGDTGSVEDGGGAGGWYNDLRTIKTAGGRHVYLAFTHASGSTIDKVAGIEAYAILNGKLVENYPFFYTKTKKLGSIDYYYSLRETTEFDYEDFPAITLSKDNKILTIPVVTEEGKVTKGKLTYVFDGEKFVYRPAKIPPRKL